MALGRGGLCSGVAAAAAGRPERLALGAGAHGRVCGAGAVALRARTPRRATVAGRTGATARAQPPAGELGLAAVVVAGYETGGQTALDLASTGSADRLASGVMSISPQPTPRPAERGWFDPTACAPGRCPRCWCRAARPRPAEPVAPALQNASLPWTPPAPGPLGGAARRHACGPGGTLPTCTRPKQDVRRGVSRGGGVGWWRRRRRAPWARWRRRWWWWWHVRRRRRGPCTRRPAQRQRQRGRPADPQLGLHTSLDFLVAVLRGDAAAQARVQAPTPPRFESAPGDTQRRGPLA